MKMLNKGEDNDTEVTWEDQHRINTFGKLNTRVGELRTQLEAKLKDRQALEDASNDVLLLDEDDEHAVMYMVGDSYVRMPKDAVEARIAALSATLDKDITALKQQVAATEGEMGTLKAALYAKFKSAINLETD